VRCRQAAPSSECSAKGRKVCDFIVPIVSGNEARLHIDGGRAEKVPYAVLGLTACQRYIEVGVHHSLQYPVRAGGEQYRYGGRGVPHS
jgi:hypothetical protein